MLNHSLIFKIIMLNKELIQHYGSEKTASAYEAMMDSLDDEKLKMKIFTVMLNGGSYGNSFKVLSWFPDDKDHEGMPNQSKVDAIKCMRRWSSVGLKEAKDIIETADLSRGAGISYESKKLAIKYVFDGEDCELYTPPYDEIVKDFANCGIQISFE